MSSVLAALWNVSSLSKREASMKTKPSSRKSAVQMSTGSISEAERLWQQFFSVWQFQLFKTVLVFCFFLIIECAFMIDVRTDTLWLCFTLFNYSMQYAHFYCEKRAYQWNAPVTQWWILVHCIFIIVCSHDKTQWALWVAQTLKRNLCSCTAQLSTTGGSLKWEAGGDSVFCHCAADSLESYNLRNQHPGEPYIVITHLHPG